MRQDESVLHLPSRKALALLAYLALRPGEFQPRDKLAALLWGDASQERARHSLRQALATIRGALDDLHPPALAERGDTVALDAASVDVDVTRFERLAASTDPEALAQAALLYRGDLAEGLAVSEPVFEEWLLTERVRLRELAVEVLARLLAHHTKAHDVERGIQTAMRLLALDPLLEAVHRTLMRLYAAQGRRGAALRQYQACLATLRQELSAEPEPETRTLYRELLQQAPEDDRADSAAAASSWRGGATGSHERFRDDGRLVGRTAELSLLTRAREQAWKGHGILAIVNGEAGAGKTRLVEEAMAQAQRAGARVPLGRAYEGEQLSFSPWVDALRGGGLVAYARQPGALAECWRVELARLFPELGPTSSSPPRSEDYVRLFEAIAVLLRAVAQQQPLMVVLEDLHWADELSIRLLTFLTRRLAGAPVSVVGSLRADELHQGHALRRTLGELDAEGRLVKVELAGLTLAETAELVGALARSGTGSLAIAHIVEQLWATSGGNPFVIVETMRTLEEADVVSAKVIPLPRKVRDVIRSRLDRLGEPPRSVLAAAAVVGREFDFAVLERVAGRPAREVAEAVEELVARRLLHVIGERLDFTHDRIREVAYEEVVPTTRRILHLAVADALTVVYRGRVDDVADQVGHHYARAGEAAKAIPHLIRFAELASQRYALDHAYLALEQAMAGVAQLPTAERDHRRLDLTLRQAFVMSTQGRLREILALLVDRAELLERVDDARLAAEYYFRLGLTRFYVGDYAQAHDAAEQALRHGERAGEPLQVGKALYVLALTSYGCGKPQAGISCATRAIPLVDRPDARYWLGLVYFSLGLNSVVAGVFDAALAATARAHAIGTAIGDSRIVAGAGYVTAWAHALRGDHDLAVATARRAVDASKDPTATGLASGALGHAHLQRGDAAAAIKVLEEVVEHFQRMPFRSAVGRHMAYLSEAYLLAGEHDRARKSAEQALELGLADRNQLIIGLSERALGRIALATGRPVEARAHLPRALGAFTECEATFEAGRTHMDLADLFTAENHPSTVCEHLAVAGEIFAAANVPHAAAAARCRAHAVTSETTAASE
jgi:DNA-binding SARP family transcriptional activator/tetratricopeptide (TPR) repeat protein